MNLYKNKIALLLVLGLSSFINAALPSNISELVETSAPAVVNITSRKEVKMQNSLRGFDEFERFFGIPRGRGFPQPPHARTAGIGWDPRVRSRKFPELERHPKQATHFSLSLSPFVVVLVPEQIPCIKTKKKKPFEDPPPGLVKKEHQAWGATELASASLGRRATLECA